MEKNHSNRAGRNRLPRRAAKSTKLRRRFERLESRVMLDASLETIIARQLPWEEGKYFGTASYVDASENPFFIRPAAIDLITNSKYLLHGISHTSKEGTDGTQVWRDSIFSVQAEEGTRLEASISGLSPRLLKPDSVYASASALAFGGVQEGETTRGSTQANATATSSYQDGHGLNRFHARATAEQLSDGQFSQTVSFEATIENIFERQLGGGYTDAAAGIAGSFISNVPGSYSTSVTVSGQSACASHPDFDSYPREVSHPSKEEPYFSLLDSPEFEDFSGFAYQSDLNLTVQLSTGCSTAGIGNFNITGTSAWTFHPDVYELYVSILDSSGVRLAEYDGNIDFVVPEDGNYFIAVRGENMSSERSVPYTLEATIVEPPILAINDFSWDDFDGFSYVIENSGGPMTEQGEIKYFWARDDSVQGLIGNAIQTEQLSPVGIGNSLRDNLTEWPAAPEDADFIAITINSPEVELAEAEEFAATHFVPIFSAEEILANSVTRDLGFTDQDPLAIGFDFTPTHNGVRIPLSHAATVLGVSHFNWIQWVVSVPEHWQAGTAYRFFSHPNLRDLYIGTDGYIRSEKTVPPEHQFRSTPFLDPIVTEDHNDARFFSVDLDNDGNFDHGFPWEVPADNGRDNFYYYLDESTSEYNSPTVRNRYSLNFYDAPRQPFLKYSDGSWVNPFEPVGSTGSNAKIRFETTLVGVNHPSGNNLSTNSHKWWRDYGLTKQWDSNGAFKDKSETGGVGTGGGSGGESEFEVGGILGVTTLDEPTAFAQLILRDIDESSNIVSWDSADGDSVGIVLSGVFADLGAAEYSISGTAADAFFVNPESGKLLISDDMAIRSVDEESLTLSIIAEYNGQISEPYVVEVKIQRSAWQNPISRFDVNNDNIVTPVDALIVINRLNRIPDSGLNNTEKSDLDHFIDVNGDMTVAPIDALMVINYLNRLSAGEGEQVWRDSDLGELGAGELTADLVDETLLNLAGIVSHSDNNFVKRRRWMYLDRN